MSTRTHEECTALADAWYAGRRDEVIEELGGEPSQGFLEAFASPVMHADSKSRAETKTGGVSSLDEARAKVSGGKAGSALDKLRRRSK